MLIPDLFVLIQNQEFYILFQLSSLFLKYHFDYFHVKLNLHILKLTITRWKKKLCVMTNSFLSFCFVFVVMFSLFEFKELTPFLFRVMSTHMQAWRGGGGGSEHKYFNEGCWLTHSHSYLWSTFQWFQQHYWVGG